MANWINPLANPTTGVMKKTASWDTPRIISNPVSGKKKAAASNANVRTSSGGQAPAPQQQNTTENRTNIQNTTGTDTAPVYDPAAAAAAAAEAKKVAEVNKFRGQANEKLNAYSSMFNSLFGRIDETAADQAEKTRNAYTGQRQSLTDDYNVEVPRIDMSYYLSGAGDSSFKLGGLGQAEKAFTDSLGKVDSAEDTDLAAIGKERATTTARYKSRQRSIEDVRREAAESDDPAELKRLVAEVTNNIRDMEADSAAFDTEAGFRGNLNKVAKVDDLGPTRSALKSLMGGAANPALKKKLATDIIEGTGASKAKKDELYKLVNGG